MFETDQNSIKSNESRLPIAGGVKENPQFPKSHASLIVGLIVLLILTIGLTTYIYVKNQSPNTRMNLITLAPESETSDNGDSGSDLDYLYGFDPGTCDYNGQVYRVGEQIPSVNGCNSCACGEDGQVECTTMSCDILNPLSDIEPITIAPDQSGKFNLNSTRLGFSASFNAQNMLVTNCQGGGEGYEFWIYSVDTDTRAGVCSYEGPVGITLTDVEDVSQVECLPNDETYSLERSEKNINNNSLIYCQSTPKNTLSYSQESPPTNPITSAYIKNPNNDSAIWVWLQDPELRSVFDQILSTFEFTN